MCRVRVSMDKPVLGFAVVSISLALVIGVVNSETTSFCSQTPYPETCESFMARSRPLVTLTQFSFRETTLNLTLDQALRAHGLISAMELSSFGERAKVAWADCVELYADTITQLNRTVLVTQNPLAWWNAQTWLSAAIANEQTCQNGFLDLNMSSYLSSFPYMLSNFSKMVSNSLAINKASVLSAASLLGKQGGNRRLLSDGFPTWVSAADRKLLQSPGAALRADVVVAADGSGNYKTISQAVAAAPGGGSKRFVIYVKRGVYKETVEIKAPNIMLIGDGIDVTVVTGSKSIQDAGTSFRSATVGITGNGFIARDMTFENTAGPQKHQAVALRSGSDLSVFYRCSFKGYQDTLYVHSNRQFYRNCDIYGTVDFIWGDAVAVLQNCNIYVRKPMSGQKNTVTAQGRTDPNENTGISIHNSLVTATSDLKAVQGSFKTYLGRPWQKYSRTVFMKTSLDSLIDPEGWLEWSGNFALSTLYYGEFLNTGPGASTSGRVKWAGFHVMNKADAQKFTVESFLGGSSWIAAAGVPFTPGL
ncbi:PREDICTED: pectinesterase-like [Nelumbo nucifera]|uniref:Pectinesterase n=1 Tax=Nelumbo nucifera TaxID=4432 RepID=A0A1U8AX58_NELNU|nr:PREDICTED: pectinesterase-like [Nelumbo nucifera]